MSGLFGIAGCGLRPALSDQFNSNESNPSFGDIFRVGSNGSHRDNHVFNHLINSIHAAHYFTHDAPIVRPPMHAPPAGVERADDNERGGE